MVWKKTIVGYFKDLHRAIRMDTVK